MIDYNPLDRMDGDSLPVDSPRAVDTNYAVRCRSLSADCRLLDEWLTQTVGVSPELLIRQILRAAQAPCKRD